LMTDSERVKALLVGHSARRPLMRASDYYKLIFQGVYGVGHIMGDDARLWLEKEAKEVDLAHQPDEPLVENISADGSIVRVNLRPYLRQGLPLEKLFSAMVETAEVEGSEEEFLESWAVFRKLAEEGELDIDKKESEALDEELQRNGIRTRHHTEAYREAYRPAYRVVKRSALKRSTGLEDM